MQCRGESVSIIGPKVFRPARNTIFWDFATVQIGLNILKCAT